MYILFYVIKLNMNIFVGKFLSHILDFLYMCATCASVMPVGILPRAFKKRALPPPPPPTIFRIVRIFKVFTQFPQFTPNNSENSDNSIIFHNPVCLFMHNYTPHIHRTSVLKYLFQLNFCRGGEI